MVDSEEPVVEEMMSTSEFPVEKTAMAVDIVLVLEIEIVEGQGHERDVADDPEAEVASANAVAQGPETESELDLETENEVAEAEVDLEIGRRERKGDEIEKRMIGTMGSVLRRNLLKRVNMGTVTCPLSRRSTKT